MAATGLTEFVAKRQHSEPPDRPLTGQGGDSIHIDYKSTATPCIRKYFAHVRELMGNEKLVMMLCIWF